MVAPRLLVDVAGFEVVAVDVVAFAVVVVVVAVVVADVVVVVVVGDECDVGAIVVVGSADRAGEFWLGNWLGKGTRLMLVGLGRVFCWGGWRLWSWAAVVAGGDCVCCCCCVLPWVVVDWSGCGVW